MNSHKMATFKGLILKLKDKTTSLEDKIKLSTFAWTSENVCIPNKHQNILDFFCGLLINKKKHNLHEKDVVLVWKTLDKFFHASGSSTIIKPSFLQAIIEGLNNVCPGGILSSDTEYISFVLRCTKQLLLSQSVSVSHFEALCSLVSTICQLLLTVKISSIYSDLQELLECSIKVVAKCHRLHLNKAQALHTLSEKILKPSLQLLSVQSCPVLMQFWINCLLTEDQHEQCATYLSQSSSECGQQGKKSVPKAILNFFTLMSSHCLKIESSNLFIFVPEFLAAFVQHKSTTPRQRYLMLKHLVSPIVSSRENTDDKDLWLTLSVRCLEVCQDTDIFVANNDSNDILKWFFQLTELVLEHKRSSVWFRYMRCVLALNHLIVEKYWTDIFNKSFTLEFTQESHNELDMFMSDLVQTYLKLRRTSDLLTALLNCLTNVTEEIVCLRKLTLFYQSLCQMFTEVPQATMLELWDKVQISAETFLQQSSPDIAPGLHWTLALYACLLENARLIDHRTGDVLHRRVCGLVKNLELNILQVLVKRKGVVKLPTVKELLHAWTVVRILLFPRWREEDVQEKQSVDREEIFKKIVKVLEPSLQVHLSVQHVNLASFKGIKSAVDLMPGQVDVDDIASRLLDLPPLNKKLVFEPWDKNSEGVSASQQAVSQFKQFTQLFPLIGHKLSDKVLDKCGHFIVDVLCVAEVDNRTIDSGQTNLFLEVQNFVFHTSTRELARLQERIVLSVWQKMFTSCRKNSKNSPKKRKLNSDDTEIVKFLTGITDKIPPNYNMSSKDLRMDLIIYPYSKLLISTLSQLDLEYLPLVNLRYQLGLLLMLGSLQREDSTDLGHIYHCVKVDLIKALSVSNLSGLFSFIDSTELLTFIVEVCKEDVEETQHCHLIQTVLHGIMNDHESVIRMAEYTKHIVQDLSQGLPDPVKLKILAYMIQFCQKYLTKAFHIPAVQDSALSIYFTISKLLIKHGLHWFSASRHPMNNPQKGGEIKAVQTCRQNKRKRPSNDFSPSPAGSGAVLECVSQVLTIWSVHVADDQTNSHLEMVVKTMIDKLMQSPQQIQETETKFLESCCLCQLRCQEAGDDSSSEKQDSHKLCFLTEGRLEEMVDIYISRCTDKVRRTFEQMRKENSGHENLNIGTPSLCTLSSPAGDSILKYGTASPSCLLETMEQWPASLAADMQLVINAVVCLKEDDFSLIMQRLLSKLVVYSEPDECPGFYVVTAIWRQLVSSPLLPPSLVKLLFHNIYEFLSAMLGCMAVVKSLQPEMSLIQRFILNSLSDFGDLGKTQISSRMILMCLDAAVMFTVTSAGDVKALYRLANTLLVRHTNTALTAVAGVISVAKKLVKSCIMLGSQQNTAYDAALGEVMTCAQLTSRLLTLLTSTSCKAELSKVAHLIVAEYILGVQEENLHTLVKNELVKGVYKIMSICDKYRFASLTASLPPGTKEIFKNLHQDFNKYHRYSGQV